MILRCTCGKRLRISEEVSGNRIKCPSCGETLIIPEAEAPVEQADEADLVEVAERADGSKRPCTTKSRLPHDRPPPRTLLIASGGMGALAVIGFVISGILLYLGSKTSGNSEPVGQTVNQVPVAKTSGNSEPVGQTVNEVPVAKTPDSQNVDPSKKDEIVYLVELDPFETRLGPWPLGKGVTGSPDTKGVIAVNGKTYPKGVGLHATYGAFPTMVRYRLNKTVKTMRTGVAYDDTNGGVVTGPTAFEICGDGKVLWKSKGITSRHQVDEGVADLTGVDVLELRVGGQGGSGAHGVWLDPVLIGPDAAAIRKAAAKK